MTDIPAQKKNRQTVSQYAKEQKSKPVSPRTHTILQIGGVVHVLTRQALRKKNFVSGQIIADWIHIIGPHYGALTLPQQVIHGTLTLACSSTTATEIQYISESIIEKINLYYGKKIVSRLKFIYQRGMPLSPSLTKTVTSTPSIVKPVKITTLPPGPLQEALARLGGQIKARKKGEL